MEKQKTILYRRKLIETASTGSERDRNSLAFSAGALQGMSRFAERYLGRELIPSIDSDIPVNFPNVEEFCNQWGELMVDAYRTALQGFYEKNPTQPAFSLDLVPWTLKTDSGRIVNATSWQHRNLQDNCRLVDPNHAAVIMTRNPPMNVETLPFQKAYLLAWHELGHLVLGNEPCKNDACIHSHPEDRERRLEEKAKMLRPYEVNGVPVCISCEDKLRGVDKLLD